MGVNLAAALAATGQLPNGVWVVFAGASELAAGVHQGGFVRKRHEGGACFADVAGTPYGTIAADGALTVTGARRVHPVVPGARFTHPVALERCWPGLELPAHAPAPCCVLELYPCATVPAPIVESLTRWCASGTRVLAVPPAPLAAAAYPSTATLAAAGVEVALGLTPELATCLAMAGWSV